MNQPNMDKKYSKISPALKCYFLYNLYYKSMTIKDVCFSLARPQSDANSIIQLLKSSLGISIKRNEGTLRKLLKLKKFK